MSKIDEIGKGPNDPIPSGRPLEHDELASQRDEVETGDDGSGLPNGTENDEDQENQAGSAASNSKKFS